MSYTDCLLWFWRICACFEIYHLTCLGLFAMQYHPTLLFGLISILTASIALSGLLCSVLDNEHRQRWMIVVLVMHLFYLHLNVHAYVVPSCYIIDYSLTIFSIYLFIFY